MSKRNRRDDFFSMVPASANKILDVGCSDGSWVDRMGKRNLEVIGIERDEKSYNQALKNLRKVFLADVEKFHLPYPDGYFDCIVYADLLEHLVDPYNLLADHRKYLNDKGCVIASIPNIRYYKAILRLALGGVWDYMDSGILDKTHLRFFTLINIKELFTNAGFEIIEIERNTIAARGVKLLNLLCFNKLKELLVYQYYVKAIKRKDKDSPYGSQDRKTVKF
jgi:2-polyprenyl-3-methyl-5-hydroxy-6-metoxy-1,4-benzoquinol methylase